MPESPGAMRVKMRDIAVRRVELVADSSVRTLLEDTCRRKGVNKGWQLKLGSECVERGGQEEIIGVLRRE